MFCLPKTAWPPTYAVQDNRTSGVVADRRMAVRLWSFSPVTTVSCGADSGHRCSYYSPNSVAPGQSRMRRLIAVTRESLAKLNR